MKKSNKGFTLIELLASIVLLGILFGLGLPALTSMITTNRDKIYVNDAKKLLSQAEYKIKAASTTIEKPDPGDCIIITMVYLDSTDFDEAPNRGEYIKDASYVVVKNNNGNLEYSAAIVERLKEGGYKGIELTKEDLLRGSNAIKYVKGINESDLKIVEAVDESKRVTTNYINKQMKDVSGDNNYITNIDNTYNNPDLEDEASVGGSEPPIITKAGMTSTSGKNYNSLDATLTVTVDDKDTSKNKLKVYISRVSYEDALDNQTGEDYGTTGSFVKEYDFAKEGYKYEDKAKIVLYIVVKDDTDNIDKTMIVYEIHNNEPPVINGDKTKSYFSKLPTDKQNRVVGLLTLDVSDDIDKVENLKFCLTEDVNATECSNYKTYSETFNFGEGQLKYSFSSNKCDLNGQVKKLKVFAKDTNGSVGSNVFEYQIHKDAAPVFDAKTPITVESVSEAFAHEGSLNVRIRVKGSDDVSYNSAMKVYISDGGAEKEFNFDPSGEIDYTLSGTYDGKNRTITARLKDECGHYSAPATYSYKVYGNTPPTIEGLTVTSRGSACLDEYPCDNTKGGSQIVNVNFRVSDDIDYNDLRNKILVCWGQSDSACCTDSGCTKLKNTQKYEVVENGATFVFDEGKEKPYDNTGTPKNFVVYAQDSYGKISRKSLDGGYKLYENQAPVIQSFDVKSDPDSKDSYFTTEHSLDVAIFVEANDDLTEFSDLSYEVKSNGQKIYTTEDSNVECKGTLANYSVSEGIKCHLNGGYDGKDRVITMTIKDHYGRTVTTTSEQAKTYTVYKNLPPRILKMPKDPDSSEPTTGDDSGDDGEGDDDLGGETTGDTGDDSGDGTAPADEMTVATVEDGIDIAPRNSDCNQNYKCPYFGTIGGSTDVTLLFDLEDDIDRMPNATEAADGEDPVYSYDDPDKGLKICTIQHIEGESFDPDNNRCTNPSNFQSYATFLNNDRAFDFPSYDGKKHILYVYAMDSFGAISKQPAEYLIYQNLVPTFKFMNGEGNEEVSHPSIHTTETNRFGNDNDSSVGETTTPAEGEETAPEELDLYKGLNRIKKAVFEIQAMDDFDEQVNLQFKICYKNKSGGSEVCPKGFVPYSPTGYEIEINAGAYNGQTYEVYAYVKDSLGAVSEKSESVDYTLYSDKVPKLKSVSASFTGGSPVTDTSGEDDDLKCAESEGKYYGPNGEELSNEDEFIEQCLAIDGKFYCVHYKGQYYNDIGEVVETKEEFDESCNVDQPGSSDTEETHICERVAKAGGGYTYYGPTGSKLNSRSAYLQQCEGYAVSPSASVGTNVVKFSIIVQDPYDTYTVCINKTGDECADNEYVGLTNNKGFDGTSLDPAYVYFVEPQGIKYNENQERYTKDGALIPPYDDEGNPTPHQDGEVTKTVKGLPSTYYVFIKDSSGDIAERITEVISGEELEKCSENNNCPAPCETAAGGKGTCSSIAPTEYVACNELEYNNYKSEFVLDTQQSSASDTITAERCSGMCYYAEAKDEYDYVEPGAPASEGTAAGEEKSIDESEKVFNTSNIFAYYQKKLFYKDRFDSTVACNEPQNISLEEYEKEDGSVDENGNPIKVKYKKHYCSFVDCFKQNKDTTHYDQYQVKAIGTFKRTIPLTGTITYTDISTGKKYESQNYHIIYTSSYDGKSDTITLNPTNNKMIPAAYEPENSIFRFNASANYDNYYVRVRD